MAAQGYTQSQGAPIFISQCGKRHGPVIHLELCDWCCSEHVRYHVCSSDHVGTRSPSSSSHLNLTSSYLHPHFSPDVTPVDFLVLLKMKIQVTTLTPVWRSDLRRRIRHLRQNHIDLTEGLSTRLSWVFFGCGARLDVVDIQGLILSPGFPSNYSSGMHCVWQFFVPEGHRLTMEMFDFDIFESSERNLTLSVDTIMSEGGEEHLHTNGVPPGGTSGIGEELDAVESKLWNTRPPLSEKVQKSVFPSSSEDDLEPPPSSSSTVTEDEAETPLLVKDTCPDDVLYITDLITFSSRFCGSRRPSDGQLVFGSEVEMVEVIVELITNTVRGRGFALVFRYHNGTSEASVGGQRSAEASVGAGEVLLAVVSLAAFFATSLTIVLCVSLRTKLCANDSCVTSSITPEVPVQNLQTDVSELHLVTANHPEQERNKINNSSLPHTGNTSEYRSFKNANLECSNGLMEMDLGADEVFVISNTDTPSFTPCVVHTHTHTHTHTHLLYSVVDTGSVQPSDWMPRSEPSDWPSRGSHVGSPRPRAWSVRTFHDFLLPFPQLNRKWCSWNLTSPFTKLVETVSPGSVMDGRDALEVPLAQHYDTSRSRTSQQISEPDGALCGPEQGMQIKICEFPADGNDDDLSIPVFAISEEDDREPLVFSEHQHKTKNDEIGSHRSFMSLGSAHLAFTDEELAVLKKNTSKIQLPSLSHVTVSCDSEGKNT
ncbi:hypothetical protein C0J50_13269 [Silurus asotus]|uniref:CUB domain-containing protein n=1 Tax=Silurus asotus TaxID=30991 RepID=A0AAD5B3D9_SILAS|nr:hypothetical protein C0J50_13269 [Silurus asotus]